MGDVVLHIRQHLPDVTGLNNGPGNYDIWAYRFSRSVNMKISL